MNGGAAGIMLWAVNALLGIVILLIGFIVRLHSKNDDERYKELRQELLRVRDRLHDAWNEISALKFKK